ncbi:acyltransferase [Polynucleobacter paneuropaeus]|nr:acyltransferase [Polynucleobacter paneuropaeus]
MRKLLYHLRRPLPDLLAFTADKLRSYLWRSQLKEVGLRFHVGRGTKIQGSKYISIGENFIAGQMLWIEAVSDYRQFNYIPSIEIGNNVCCSQSVHITATERITIKDGVLFGSHVHVTDHGHGTYNGNEQDSPDTPPSYRRISVGRPVTIEKNVWIGDGVVVLPGVTIGEGSIIGSNSVVSRNIPANVIAVGIPAIPIKLYDPTSSRWIPIAKSI